MNELETLLRERAPGPPTPPESSPWEFLLAEEDIGERVWPVVSRLLTDGDPVVRARALEFVMTWRDDRTLPRLVEVAGSFGDDLVDGVALRERMQHAIANRCTGRDAPTIAPALLSTLRDGEEPSIAAAPVLGAQFPDRAAEIAARSSLDWAQKAAVAVALYRRDQLLDFLRVAGRAELIETAEQSLEHDTNRAQKIAAKLGLPGPTRPAPTRDELERAIRK
jgi:hypothetical protein